MNSERTVIGKLITQENTICLRYGGMIYELKQADQQSSNEVDLKKLEGKFVKATGHLGNKEFVARLINEI